MNKNKPFLASFTFKENKKYLWWLIFKSLITMISHNECTFSSISLSVKTFGVWISICLSLKILDGNEHSLRSLISCFLEIFGDRFSRTCSSCKSDQKQDSPLIDLKSSCFTWKNQTRWEIIMFQKTDCCYEVIYE